MKKRTLLFLLFALIFTFTFGQNSFREKMLVYRSDGKIDFIESYLNLCLLVDSTIDKAAYYKEVDVMCDEVKKEIEGYKTPQELIEKINNYLFHMGKFMFNSEANKYVLIAENEKEVKNSGEYKNFIVMSGVLKNREGVCVSLSMIYLTIAYKLELPIFGVVVPGHFFVRYNDGQTKINIETTSMGKECNDKYYRENMIKRNKGIIYLKDLNYEQTIGFYSETIGDALSDEKFYIQSLECYNLAIQINPLFAMAYQNRGIAKFEIQDFKGAIADYNMVLEIDPDMAEIYNDRGLVKYKLKDYNGSIADFKRAIEMNPKLAAFYYNMGLAKYNKQDYTGAIIDYSKSIEINPEDARFYLKRGNAKCDLHDDNGAIIDFTRAIELNPNDKSAFINRGSSKSNIKDYNGAIADFSKAIEIDHEAVMAYFDRGSTRSVLNDFNGAIVDLTKALEINPDYTDAYYNRGIAKGKIQDYMGAISDYTMTIEIDPKYVNAYLNRGNLNYEIKDYNGAVADFDQLILINPNDAYAYFFRGISKIYLGLKDSGCKDMNKAKELGDEDAPKVIMKYCQ